MAGLDLSGFVGKEETYPGLAQAASNMRIRQYQLARLQQQQEGRQAATSKYLENTLSNKNYLTGTDYDPVITSKLEGVMTQAQQLASKGANLGDINMAIGPQLQELNQYHAKAKLINDSINNGLTKLTPYTGYNKDALMVEARKAAFHNPDGSLKDISSVDPSLDYLGLAAKNNPEAVTTGKGLDDFVDKAPMSESDKSVTTSYAGRSKVVNYTSKHPFWEGLNTDAQGKVATDAQGNPTGIGVIGAPITGDDGKPMINPETNQPYNAMDKTNFNAIMTHNPDIADYIRGEVSKHFTSATQDDKTGQTKVPAEGSPQWDAMARAVLGQELQARSKNYFKINDQQKETAPAIKVEIGENPGMLDATNKYHQASSGTGDYFIPTQHGKQNGQVKTNAVQAIGGVFNNDPTYLNGEQKEMDFGNGNRNVVDITPYLPGGGLKTGKSADDAYKSVYYDPQKRSLIVESESKTKDAQGNKSTSYEEVPESKAGLFMTRIAGANGIDPTKVPQILTGLGYQNAKFKNAADANEVVNQMQAQHQEKINTALQNDKFDDLKGLKTPAGTIEKVDTRDWTFGGIRDKYAVDVKGADGKVEKMTFKTKEDLAKFVQQSTPAKTTTTDYGKKYGY